jgi:hypothetical protein
LLVAPPDGISLPPPPAGFVPPPNPVVPPGAFVPPLPTAAPPVLPFPPSAEVEPPEPDSPPLPEPPPDGSSPPDPPVAEVDVAVPPVAVAPPPVPPDVLPGPEAFDEQPTASAESANRAPVQSGCFICAVSPIRGVRRGLVASEGSLFGQGVSARFHVVQTVYSERRMAHAPCVAHLSKPGRREAWYNFLQVEGTEEGGRR